MSDLRVNAGCMDCDMWISGTSAVERAAEHVDRHHDHRVIITKSGDLSMTTFGDPA